MCMSSACFGHTHDLLPSRARDVYDRRWKTRHSEHFGSEVLQYFYSISIFGEITIFSCNLRLDVDMLRKMIGGKRIDNQPMELTAQLDFFGASVGFGDFISVLCGFSRILCSVTDKKVHICHWHGPKMRYFAFGLAFRLCNVASQLSTCAFSIS